MAAGLASEKKQQEILFSDVISYFLVSTAVLIATIYRLYGIDRLSLWADELWGVMACSRGSWMAMVQDLVTNDNHPPGYQTILYFVMQWFGDTEILIRMPSALAGITTVFLVYHIGKKLLSAEVGLLAAFIVAGSYQSIYYSQEARAYTLLALFCTLNSWHFINLFVLEKINNKNTLLFSLGALACAYLHYAGLLFVVCELLLCLFLIGIRRDKKMLKAAAYGFGIITILYIKWLPVMIAQMHNDEFYWEKTPTIYSLFKTVNYLLGPDNTRTLVYSAGFLAAIYFACRALMRPDQEKNHTNYIVPVMIFLVLSPLAAVLVKSWLFSSIYTGRYFIFVIPLASMLSAHGLVTTLNLIDGKKNRQMVFAAILVFVCFASLIFNRDLYTGNFGKQDFRGAVAFVGKDSSLLSEQGLIIVSHEFFDYYLKKQQSGYQSQGYLVFPRQLAQIVQRIDKSGAKSFYYLEVAETGQTPINNRLALRYRQVSARHFSGINVIKYSTALSH